MGQARGGGGLLLQMAKKKEKGKGGGNSVTFELEDPDEACERLTGIAPANETHTFRLS